MSNVLPGVAEVFANFLLLHNILIRLDLPTFDLPMKAYSGLLSAGHIDTVGALRVNSAFFISIVLKFFNFLNFFNFPLSIHPRSEDFRPDPHHRTATFHSDGIVVAHAPRTLTEVVGTSKITFLDLVEESACSHKLAPYLLVVVYVGCHHHQSPYPHGSQNAQFEIIKQLPASVGRESVHGF